MILEIACNSTGMLFVCRTWAHKRAHRYSERENSKRFSRGRPLAKKMFPPSPRPAAQKRVLFLRRLEVNSLPGRSTDAIARFFRSWPLDTAITMRQTRDKTLSPDFLFPVDRERERESCLRSKYTRGTNDKRGKGMTPPLFLDPRLVCTARNRSFPPPPRNRISIWGM